MRNVELLCPGGPQAFISTGGAAACMRAHVRGELSITQRLKPNQTGSTERKWKLH